MANEAILTRLIWRVQSNLTLSIIATLSAVGALACLGSFVFSWQELSLNLYAGLIMALISLVGGLVVSRPFGLRRGVNFSPIEFCTDMGRAKSTIRIMDIWLWRLLGEANSQKLFKRELKEGVKRGVRIEIVICLPESDAALARAVQLLRSTNSIFHGEKLSVIHDRMHVQAGLLLSSEEVLKYEARNAGIKKPSIEIRLSSAAPKIALYQIDQRIYWNFYPSDRVVWDVPMYQIDRRSNDDLVTLMDWLFSDFWSAADVSNMDEYQEYIKRGKYEGKWRNDLDSISVADFTKLSQ